MHNSFLSHTWCCMHHLYWANCNLMLQPHAVYSYSTADVCLGSQCLLWCCQGRCDSHDGQVQQLRGYKLFMKVYLYIPEQGTFEAVPGMPYHLPKQICEAQDVLQQIDRAGTAAFTCFQRRTAASCKTPAASGQNAAPACWLSLLHSLLKCTEPLVYALHGAVVFPELHSSCIMQHLRMHC